MLRGHIDKINRRIITGWAASADRPDEIEDISIFVNGAKTGQAACALPREDLKKLGHYGEGAHGFSFSFAEALDEQRDHHLAIRFSRTGNLLPGGDMMIRANGGLEDCKRATHRLIHEPAPIPAPRNPRGLFELLAQCDDTSTLYDLLGRVDFTGLELDDAHATVFGEPDVSGSVTHLPEPLTSFRDYVNHLLISGRFQRNLMPILLNAFPEKRRLIFVHIPKCAGTSFSDQLMGRFPGIHQSLTDPAWTSPDDFFWVLSRFLLNLRMFDTIFLAGHNSLSYYSSHGLIRRFDHVVTVVRDPLEIAESTVNYMMTRFAADTKTGVFAPDTKGWLAALGRDDLQLPADEADIQELCGEILLCPHIIYRNSMCQWLGGENARDALRQLAVLDVEVLLLENQAEWLQETWNIESEKSWVKSTKIVSSATMQRLNPHLKNLASEDISLYSTIRGAIERSGKLSVRGRELLEAGAQTWPDWAPTELLVRARS